MINAVMASLSIWLDLSKTYIDLLTLPSFLYSPISRKAERLKVPKNWIHQFKVFDIALKTGVILDLLRHTTISVIFEVHYVKV